MPSFLSNIQTLPQLGFGLGLKDSLSSGLLALNPAANPATQGGADWLEIIPENYMDRGGRAFQQLKALQKAGYRFASHGVNLSLGSVGPLNPHYLEALEALFKQVEPLWFSDHLSFSAIYPEADSPHAAHDKPHYLNDLIPLPFSNEAVEVCVGHIQEMKTRFGRPFLIENISYYARFPHPDFPQEEAGLQEAAFLTAILEEADCGLLLDINNVYVNSQNHGYNPITFMQALPLHRVVEIHIAGHLQTDSMIIDTHGEPLIAPVLELFSWLYPCCPNLKGVLLERDTNVPPLPELLAELDMVRSAATATSQLLEAV